MKAVVYKSTGSWYVLRDEEGQLWQGRIKGRLRIDDEISSTNPIAVGDTVFFEPDDAATHTAIISDIAPRHNYIVRVSPHNQHQKHIVAANLDAALLVATVSHPRTSQGFIDRFLITAEAYHIPAIIVINKMDLLKEKDKKQLTEWQTIYGAAGYEVLTISALQEGDLSELKHRLAGKKTLFSGHSGVGKSTLINRLIPDLNLRTAEVSDWSGKGQHTTTFAEMLNLPAHTTTGAIIDTPGVKEFGLIDIEPEELSHFFPEMRALLNDCRFNNCMHLREPGCAVKAAVAGGQLSEKRYDSYLGILAGLQTS